MPSAEVVALSNQFWAKFQEAEFVAYLKTGFTMDQHGQLKIVMTIPREYADELLPNICYTAGVPIKVRIGPYDVDD